MRVRLLISGGTTSVALALEAIAPKHGVHVTRRHAFRQLQRRLVEEGLEAALTRKQQEQPCCTPIFDGEAEAKLIALASSSPL